jgi:hypothetical protein
MKKEIFKKAWSLFRMYQMTFSQALTKAWNDFKRSLLVDALWKIASSNKNAKAKAKQALDNFPTITNRLIRRNIVNNSGASSYYNGLTFNAD